MPQFYKTAPGDASVRRTGKSGAKRLGAGLLGLLTMLFGACASDVPHRTAGLALPNPSFEEVPYQTPDGGKGSYAIGYVEFDDQGWFQDVAQRNVLFRQLRGMAGKGQKFLIVVYAHGWNHNADENDANVGEFRKLLEELDLVERESKGNNAPRKVVGVYLGWRGLSIPIPGVELLTFWARKNAAERIGNRSAKQLLIELNQFRAFSNGWQSSDWLAGPDQTQLIYIGHSFGGLILYDALQTELMERLLRVGADGNYKVAKSFGDFILLINPAFEGAAFEPLWQAALTRNCFPVQQRPIMAIITSETDWATHYAFPFGRLYTFTQSAPHAGERDAVMNTVGHLSRYLTHVLSASGQPEPPQAAASAHVPSVKKARKVLADLQSRQAVVPTDEPQAEFDGGRLDRVDNPVLPARFPYLVVSARKEMIDGHNDIWRPRFRDFMLHFVAQQIMRPPPPDEVATSCRAFAPQP